MNFFLKLFSILFLVLFFRVSVSAQPHYYFQGLGTEIEPYEIWNKDDFLVLADSVWSDAFVLMNGWHLDKHFRLMQDIDTIFELPKWFPGFRGHLQGNGKTIYVGIADAGYRGIFGSVGTVFENGSIDNLIIEGYIYNGGVIVYNWGTISNVTSNVTIVSSAGGAAGGIANNNAGIISNSVFNGSIVSIGAISGIGGIGGIVGENECGVGGQIINCINNGKIIASTSGSGVSSGVGGIAGIRFNAGSTTLSGNINNGIVEGQNNVGGIIGRVTGITTDPIPASVTDNVNNGFVKGANAVGGIIGNSGTATTNVNIFNNFNSGVVIGVSETGCIVGRNTGGTVSNNHYDKQMCAGK